MMSAYREERGIGLIVALVVMLVFLGVSAAVIPIAVTEMAVSANHRRAVRGLYAAQAALEWVTYELDRLDVWDDVLRGRVMSQFWSPTVQIPLAGQALLDLSLVTDQLNDEHRGVGPALSRKRWRLFLHGSFDQLVPTSTPLGTVVVAAWISDDLGELDGDPFADSNGTLLVRASSFGPAHTRRAVEATVRRRVDARTEVVAWRVEH